MPEPTTRSDSSCPVAREGWLFLFGGSLVTLRYSWVEEQCKQYLMCQVISWCFSNPCKEWHHGCLAGWWLAGATLGFPRYSG